MCGTAGHLTPFTKAFFFIKLRLDSPCFCSNSWISVLGSSSVSVSPSRSGSTPVGDWDWERDRDCCGWFWHWVWLTDRIWMFIPTSGASEAKKAAGPSMPTAGDGGQFVIMIVTHLMRSFWNTYYPSWVITFILKCMCIKYRSYSLVPGQPQRCPSPSMMTSLVTLRCDSTRGACSSPRRVLERRGRASVLGCTIRGSCRFLRCFCSSSALFGANRGKRPLY